ncbi:MAG: hypothetical protein IPF73_06415 [Betaproteobacteria bacterium]|nr:hypothetical protein [Betaproteobacteria bacterium]
MTPPTDTARGRPSSTAVQIAASPPALVPRLTTRPSLGAGISVLTCSSVSGKSDPEPRDPPQVEAPAEIAQHEELVSVRRALLEEQRDRHHQTVHVAGERDHDRPARALGLDSGRRIERSRLVDHPAVVGLDGLTASAQQGVHAPEPVRRRRRQARAALARFVDERTDLRGRERVLKHDVQLVDQVGRLAAHDLRGIPVKHEVASSAS